MNKQVLAATFALFAFAGFAAEQVPPDQGGGGPPPQGGPGGPGGNIERQLERAQDLLALDDDKWAALAPKVKAVLEAQRAAQPMRGPGGGPGGGQGGPQGGPQGGGPGGGGDNGQGGPPPGQDNGGGGPPQGGPDGGPGGGQGGGQGGPPDQRNASEVQKALTSLRELIQSDKPSPDEIKSKVEAFRAALTKARTKLADARKTLAAAVTPEQEAVLIAMSILE